MKPRDSVLELWRSVLGEVPEEEKLGQLESLNDVSPAVVAVARRLGSARKAAGLISSYLRPDRQISIESFVQEVVFGKTSPEIWRRGRNLVPAWSFTEQVTLAPPALVAPVGGRFASRLVPSLPDWESGVSWIGAPCLPEPGADYLSPVPEHAVALRTSQFEPVPEPSVAVRRWIAARIAAVVKKQVGMDFRDAGATAAAYVPLSAWTPDALAALQALVRESKDLGLDQQAPPGFRGPDEWFRSQPA